MASYAPISILTGVTANRVVAASATNQVVGDVTKIQADDSRDMYIICETSAVNGTGGVVKLQQCARADGTYTNVSGATVTISGAGVFLIEINTIDGAGSALLPYIRIVATTGVGDAFTIDRLYKTSRHEA